MSFIFQMCPISAALQLVIVIFSLMLIACAAAISAEKWMLSWHPQEPVVHMGEVQTIKFNISGKYSVIPTLSRPFETCYFVAPDNHSYTLETCSRDKHVVNVDKHVWLMNDFSMHSFNITGTFLGKYLPSKL